MPNKATLNIFIPQLFESLAEWHKNYQFVPKAPLLVPLLATFHPIKTSYTGMIETLYGEFGFDSKSTYPPHAKYCYQCDFAKSPEKQVLLATPIHLQTGMTDVSIDGLPVMDISLKEADELLELINLHFNQDDIKFERSEAGRWYVILKASDMPDKTFPVHDVLGNSLFPFLHHSKQLSWNRLLNELQMLLYSAPTNQNREVQSKREVSSFWLWGNEKSQQEFRPSTTAGSIIGGAFDGQAFAYSMDTPWYDLMPENIATKSIATNSVIIIDELLEPMLCNDIEKWQLALTEIEKNIIQPLIKHAKNNQLELIIHTCNGQRWINNKWYNRFLKKKKKSLLDYI